MFIGCVGVILNPCNVSLACPATLSFSNSTKAMSLRPGTSLTSLNPGNLKWKNNKIMGNTPTFQRYWPEQHSGQILIGCWRAPQLGNLLGFKPIRWPGLAISLPFIQKTPCKMCQNISEFDTLCTEFFE